MARTTFRTAALTLLAAGVFLAVGCGTSSSCATETPQITSVPACSDMAQNTTVTVHLDVCPTCNQTDLSCDVDLTQVGSSGIIQLDPLAHACDSSSSCPPSCSQAGVTCTFKTPAAGDYSLLVVDSAGNSTTRAFRVDNSGTATSCTL